MAYTPLALQADLRATALQALIPSGMSSGDVDKLMARASRSVEGFAKKRLAVFTNLAETVRAQDVDADADVDIQIPYDITSVLGMSRATSLGTTQLVRHLWVNQKPSSQWNDLWQGSVASVNILRAFSGTQLLTIAGTAIQYEQDTGHMRFPIGTFIPQGSTFVVTYSGGYNPVPDDLIEATCYRAAEMLVVRSYPQRADKDVDALQLREAWQEIVAEYADAA